MGQDSGIPARPGLSGSGWGARNSGGTFFGLRVSLTAVIIARLDTSLCCGEHGRSPMEIRYVFQVLSEGSFGLSKKRLKMMLFQSKIVVAPSLDRK